ncbi:TAP42-like family protein [Pseudomassariella vexata]|uniref:TAP42-like family protein n=1 Tax=Pseudomassariella vexata TaxID=1141098 RepID=A0A1Y2DUD1_9PEZI|nr:TAP42-like family protein [Pseudomassariella vexata]ORY62881.1 TAP42-like family protein [Pseudomassariella vexata]
MVEPRSLKSVFQGAEKKRLALEGSFEASSPTYAEDLEFALNSYQECLQIIGKISLFSDNEGHEDLNTSDLPYLLINYRIAELLQKISVTSPLERKSALQTTRDAYERFLHILDSYCILSKSDAKLFAEYNENPESFSTVSTSDPTARRNAKIANFKQEKELKQKLAHMQSSPRYLEDGGDDESVRELHFANIAFCAHMTFQGLESINRELEVLSQAPVPLIPTTTTVQEDERLRLSVEGENYSERLDRPLQRLESAFKGPILSKQGKPLRPFTLTSTRQDIQKGVFKPGHNLPTMSIDEYLEEERKRGGIIEGGGEASGRQATPDEDNYDKADAETMKAREWDEFVESNPKGSGNTLNRG